MATKPETALRTRIVKALRQEGGFWEVIHGSAYQRAGLPDIIGCLDGRYYGLEVKVPGREAAVTPRQARTLEEITRAGGVAGVISSVDQALHLVRVNRQAAPPII